MASLVSGSCVRASSAACAAASMFLRSLCRVLATGSCHKLYWLNSDSHFLIFRIQVLCMADVSMKQLQSDSLLLTQAV